MYMIIHICTILINVKNYILEREQGGVHVKDLGRNNVIIFESLISK